MAVSVHAPRINNNDDEVTLVSIDVAVGDWVTSGKVIAQVETEKASVDVDAPVDGFVLGIVGEVGSQVSVGSVLMWLGTDRNEPVPQDRSSRQTSHPSGSRAGIPTGKVRLMLREYGLDPAEVPASGDRLTVEDVRRYLAQKNKSTPAVQPRAKDIRAAGDILPDIPGEWHDLRPDEKGMLATVAWHHDHAVPGYIELRYDPGPWERFSAEFANRHKLLLSPLLSLMAWRLARIVTRQRKLNSTILSGRRFEYSTVNLGFTVQVGETLYLCVLRNSGESDALEFVKQMGALQRQAAAHKLGSEETQGATVGFSSMARWNVSRHIPVLAPNTTLMVAHAAGIDGKAVLGASYDHRVVTGFHVVSALRSLAMPPEQES